MHSSSLYICAVELRKEIVSEKKVKIIEKTEHVGITCADEITSSSQSRTRGIFCSVSFQEVCLCDKQKLRSFF